MSNEQHPNEDIYTNQVKGMAGSEKEKEEIYKKIKKEIIEEIKEEIFEKVIKEIIEIKEEITELKKELIKEVKGESAKEEEEIPEEEGSEFLIFQLKEGDEEFEKAEIKRDVPLHSLLYHDLILIFIDSWHKTVWIWHGSEATTKMKFISTQRVSQIRNNYAFDYKIASIDDGDESLEFNSFVGL